MVDRHGPDVARPVLANIMEPPTTNGFRRIGTTPKLGAGNLGAMSTPATSRELRLALEADVGAEAPCRPRRNTVMNRTSVE